MARYYFYTTKNYDTGFETIEDAIEAASQIEGYAMGSLYHIEAMGFVSRITYVYLQKIRTSINHYKRFSDVTDINTIKDCIHSTRVDLANAAEYFDKARTEENSRFISNIAECKLILSIQSDF